MRIIKESTLAAFAFRHPPAATGLAVWRRIMRQEQFRHFAGLRQSFRAADQVRVASGNPVVVFNVCGNTYRLICAIHFDTGKVFLLRFPDARGIQQRPMENGVVVQGGLRLRSHEK